MCWKVRMHCVADGLPFVHLDGIHPPALAERPSDDQDIELCGRGIGCIVLGQRYDTQMEGRGLCQQAVRLHVISLKRLSPVPDIQTLDNRLSARQSWLHGC